MHAEEADHDEAQGKRPQRVQQDRGTSFRVLAPQPPGIPDQRQRDAHQQPDGAGVGPEVDAGGSAPGLNSNAISATEPSAPAITPIRRRLRPSTMIPAAKTSGQSR